MINFVDVTVAKEIEVRLRKPWSRFPSTAVGHHGNTPHLPRATVGSLPPSLVSLTGATGDAEPFAAADALALLHELQVHQVELELQAEELRESRAELEAMLQRQIVLYDHQPVACFTIDRGLVVQELNLQGAALLDLPREEAYGLRIDVFLSDEGAARLRRLLAGAASGPLELALRPGPRRKVLAQVNADPQGERHLLTWTPLE